MPSQSQFELSQGLALPPLPKRSLATAPLIIDWLNKFTQAMRSREADTSQNSMRLVESDVLANRPAVAPGGAIWLATDTMAVYVFDSATGMWVLITVGGGGGGFTVTPTTTSVTPFTVPAGIGLVAGSATAGFDQIINLPAATGSGRLIIFKKMDANPHDLVITPAGADTIDGSNVPVHISVQYDALNLADIAAGVWIIW
jgi:hypothetical protein